MGRLDVLVWGEHAVRLDLLTELAALEASEVWKAEGAVSMVDWLVGRYQVSVGTARQWLRVARALQQLPRIRGVFADGELSWDQLRALLGVVTPDTETEWAQQAPAMSVAELRAAGGGKNCELPSPVDPRTRLDHPRRPQPPHHLAPPLRHPLPSATAQTSPHPMETTPRTHTTHHATGQTSAAVNPNAQLSMPALNAPPSRRHRRLDRPRAPAIQLRRRVSNHPSKT